MSRAIAVLGFAAFSGTGKTTLLRELLPLLAARGLRIGVVKHAHHEFDTDVPGKDSYELRKAGATQMLVASRRRWALVTETPQSAEPRLEDLLGHLDAGALDLVLVEGFKAEPIPKIELHRPSLGYPLLQPKDPSIVAVASDATPATPVSVPVLDINKPDDIADFVLNFLTRSNSLSDPKATGG